MRRYTRLTNAFSKKLENLEHAVSLYFFAYNFIIRHTTLRMPPALKAGVTDHVWTYEELVGLIDRYLAEGRPADVVVFDPKTVGPGPLKRVYDLPAGADRLVSEASGIDAVIVNGKLIRRDGKDAVAANDKLPGRLLRQGKAA